MSELYFQIKKVKRIIERQNAADWSKKNIYYENEFVLVLIMNGEIEYRIGEECISLKKNDLALFSPGNMRSGIAKSNQLVSYISIILQLEANEQSKDLFRRPVMVMENVADSYRKLFMDARKTWMQKEALFLVRVHMICTEILYNMVFSTIHNYTTPHHGKLEAARTQIHEQFRQNLSVAELAGAIEMSVAYFRRLFRAEYGCSPMQYIMNLRIENAKDLLLSGETNVTEAADLSGFEDIYYFSKIFKAKTGITPSELMKHKQEVSVFK